MQMARPEGYEDCIATRGIEKGGSSNTLRDAVAIMYSGTYATHAVANGVLTCYLIRWCPHSQSLHNFFVQCYLLTLLKDQRHNDDIPCLYHVSTGRPAENP